jgi:hypothetical protein
MLIPKDLSMHRKLLFPIAILFLPGLVACVHSGSAPVQEEHFKPTATVQDIMLSLIDPSADGIWNSVSTTITKTGTEEKQPRTDQEWQEVRRNAITLIEGANLLLINGRQVAAKGVKSENPGIEEGPEEVQRLLDADRESYVKFAHALHDSGVQALAAIDAKNPAELVAVGGRIDEACEQCHQRYWYPNQNKSK